MSGGTERWHRGRGARGLLLALLLGSAVPLAAQENGGRVVRVQVGPLEPTGTLLRVRGDTLRIVSPELGLAEIPQSALTRLEVQASDALRLGIVVMASAVVGGAVGAAQGEDVVQSTVLGAAVVSMVGLPGGPTWRWRTVVRLDTAWSGGATVRVSAPGHGLSAAVLTLQDFRADTLLINGTAPLPRAEVARLELNLGRDYRRGAATGRKVGALAGFLGATALVLREGNTLVLFPVSAIGAGVGATVGGAAGHLLAPRVWKTVPLR